MLFSFNALVWYPALAPSQPYTQPFCFSMFSTVVNQLHGISSVQFSCSVMSDSATPGTAARQASLSITNSQSLLKLMSTELVMPYNHLILCRPLLFPPSIFPSIRVFSNESVLCIRWPKYWSFSFSISPSNEYSGLISFRMDWSDLLAVQGTRKSLLQHHSSKALHGIVNTLLYKQALCLPSCRLIKSYEHV